MQKNISLIFFFIILFFAVSARADGYYRYCNFLCRHKNKKPIPSVKIKNKLTKLFPSKPFAFEKYAFLDNSKGYYFIVPKSSFRHTELTKLFKKRIKPFAAPCPIYKINSNSGVKLNMCLKFGRR